MIIETIARIPNFGNIGWSKTGNVLFVILSNGDEAGAGTLWVRPNGAELGRLYRPGPTSRWEYNIRITVRVSESVSTLILTGKSITRKEAKGLIEARLREWVTDTNRAIADLSRDS